MQDRASRRPLFLFSLSVTLVFAVRLFDPCPPIIVGLVHPSPSPVATCLFSSLLTCRLLRTSTQQSHIRIIQLHIGIIQWRVAIFATIFFTCSCDFRDNCCSMRCDFRGNSCSIPERNFHSRSRRRGAAWLIHRFWFLARQRNIAWLSVPRAAINFFFGSSIVLAQEKNDASTSKNMETTFGLNFLNSWPQGRLQLPIVLPTAHSKTLGFFAVPPEVSSSSFFTVEPSSPWLGLDSFISWKG